MTSTNRAMDCSFKLYLLKWGTGKARDMGYGRHIELRMSPPPHTHISKYAKTLPIENTAEELMHATGMCSVVCLQILGFREDAEVIDDILVLLENTYISQHEI